MKAKILIVDDDQEILEITGRSLRSHDYHVLTATNGRSALEMINQEIPDLVLTDVLMPEMDGFTFYKELKNNPLTNNIPVLIITGRGKMEETFKVVGADGFLCKPFSPGDLINEIDRVIKTTVSSEGIKIPGAQSEPVKVLAIGCDKIILDNMRFQAQKEGFDIAVVLDGEAGLKEAVKYLPDIVFADVLLQDMPCAGLVKELRNLPQLAKKPIIGFCYYSVNDLGDTQVRKNILRINELSKKLIQSGASHYIGRYNHQIFVKTIRRYLSCR